MTINYKALQGLYSNNDMKYERCLQACSLKEKNITKREGTPELGGWTDKEINELEEGGHVEALFKCLQGWRGPDTDRALSSIKRGKKEGWRDEIEAET